MTMVKTVRIFDSVVDDIPNEADVAAMGYVAGSFPTVFQRWFENLKCTPKITIAIRPDEVADMLDVEPGDATDAEAASWITFAAGKGVYLPRVYRQASGLDGLVAELHAAGHKDRDLRIMSAHYGTGAHICGPTTCGLVQWPHVMATQYTDKALGRNLDESMALENFLLMSAPDPHPADKYLDHTLRHGLKDADGHGSSLKAISERGRVKTYDEIMAKGGAKAHPKELAAVQHDALLLFGRLWAIVHDGGVKAGSNEAQLRWSANHRGARGRTLWAVARGKR